MNKRKIISTLIAAEIVCVGDGTLRNKGEVKVFTWLADNGFAEGIPGHVLSTDATPLALLDQPCLERANKLASEPQLLCLTRVENHKHYDSLVESGLAVMIGGCTPRWEPTKKLRAAVKCWREARGK